MRRKLYNFLENVLGIVYSDLKMVNTCNAEFLLHMGDGHTTKVMVQKRTRRQSDSLKLVFWCCGENYPIRIADLDLRWESFADWIQYTVKPAYIKQKLDLEKIQGREETVRHITHGDPRIEMGFSQYGLLEISFKVENYTDAAKLADLYREYFNGTRLPAGWRVNAETGMMEFNSKAAKEDTEAYWKEIEASRAEEKDKILAETAKLILTAKLQ